MEDESKNEYVPNKKDIRYFNIAKEVAKTSNCGRIKIGCVIVKKHDILSVSCNLKKSHPIQKKMNIYRFQEIDACSHYVHAEMNALLKAPYNTLEGSSLYVYREGKMGELRMSRPCPACFEALKEEGVSYIYYTDETGFRKEKVLDK